MGRHEERTTEQAEAELVRLVETLGPIRVVELLEVAERASVLDRIPEAGPGLAEQLLRNALLRERIRKARAEADTAEDVRYGQRVAVLGTIGEARKRVSEKALDGVPRPAWLEAVAER